MRDDMFAPYRAGLGNPGRTPALVARRQAAQPVAPAVQPPAEPNGMLQSGAMMPPAPVPLPEAPPLMAPNPYAAGAGPLPEEPALTARNPYTRPAPMAAAPAAPQPGPQMSADDLNRMVLALLQGSGGNTDQENLLRQQMAMAPQQGGLY
jgi:hypothetical protein